MKWVVSGLRSGIRSTTYPREIETAPGTTPGLPAATEAAEEAATLVGRCPTHALGETDGRVSVDYRRCVHCYRCRYGTGKSLEWSMGYEWAGMRGEGTRLGAQFRRSVHVLVVDAGDCGACLNEVRQLNNPYYNMHRLGFFVTPTPRHADVLLVVGGVTDQMRTAVEKIYEAMPTPKRVVAVGACALSGGVFADSFACATGVDSVLPVDVEVPGNPPPPLAILHGLLVAVGRKAPASLISESTG